MPVTARVARARAANLVLIDMENSILVLSGHCGPHAQLDGGLRKRFEGGREIWFRHLFLIYFI